MKKQVRNFKVDFNFDWTYGVEISKLREDLDALEKLGVTHVDIEPELSYDCAYVEIEAHCNRIETDEEYKQRIDEQKRRDDEVMRRDLEQLQKLQEKYKK